MTMQIIFFTGSAPSDRRRFIIAHDGEAVGFISYCFFHLKPHKSELDIWLNSEANCGKGFGTDAIVSLVEYLAETLGVCECIMRPSVKNARAVAAYKKAGFEASAMLPGDYFLDEYVARYGDGDYGEAETALLVKRVTVQTNWNLQGGLER